ncbi:EH signature domain-containing protein [Blastochloris tepida]|uniref:Zorya protein ZorC EH domain-containing protein n=1 Tax=Blastochloris tepida TaxID=2233851 RepID=A0A348G321_9HYPH|nr:EH signature domain-containing protein [Blastochloris tepida]BBF93954.1 hypothetical protein BLTE_26390 [Blastochloris tepida]
MAESSTLTPTREVLGRLAAAVKVLRATKLPEAEASAQALVDLGAAGRAPKPPEKSMLDQARSSILAAAQSRAYTQVPAKYLREAPWLLWAVKQPLAGLPGLLDAVVALAMRHGSVRRKLIQAWLLGFDANAPMIEAAGHAIRRLLAETPDARLDAWRNVDRALNLFDARFGPRRVADAILTAQRSVAAILQEVGLDDPVQAGGGYARAVQGEVLMQFATTLPKAHPDEIVARCLAFLAPGGRLRFEEPGAQGAVARGLLAPWLRGGSPPSDATRAEIQAFLLRALGDPRLRPQHWREAGDEATALMRRWLARASLKLFFDLIDDYALDDHWRYREAFWAACLNKGLIEDAWLALGKRVFASARALKDLNGAYARLEGASGDQSVLLMRIGSYVFCDWSHNGKLRAWQADWKNAPHLGARSYSRDDLTGKGLPFPPNAQFGSRGAPDGDGLSHIGSKRSYWQGSAAELIARRTGVRLSPTDWMPR